jgi:hypothetical protein
MTKVKYEQSSGNPKSSSGHEFSPLASNKVIPSGTNHTYQDDKIKYLKYQRKIREIIKKKLNA